MNCAYLAAAMKRYAGFKRLARSKPSAAVGSLLAAAIVIESTAAYAVEGGVYGAPLGGTDIRQAYLPPTPGFYGGLAGVGSFSDYFHDQNGGYSQTSNPARLNAGIMGAGILYVYPYNPFGFTVASSFQLQYITESQAITVNGVHKSGNGSGFQDSYTDLFYASRYLGLFGATPGSKSKLKYGLTFAFGLAAEIPLGAYQVNNFVNPGKNTFITIPSMALTYLTGPNLSFFDGTEISARFFFDTNKRNVASGYQGGNLIDLDYAITQRMGNFQFGLFGDYAQQLNGDHSTTYALVSPGGNIFEKIDLGPVIAYDSPELATTFKFKATFPVFHTNNYNSHQFIFTASKKLF